MPPKRRSAYPLPSPPPSTSPPPPLLCFSHLRWRFVYQRPQHLLSRAARTYRVYFFEEPLIEDAPAPRLDLDPQPCGAVVAAPVLPQGMGAAERRAALRALLDRLLAPHAAEPLTLWYYTPMALPFSDHLEAALCVYDCMDELSAFRGAPPELVALERELFARADLVFTGGASLYEAKRSRHRRVYCFPSSIDAAHFAQGRHLRTGNAEPPDQASLARPRLGFFGVIDERMDLALVAAIADLRPDWQLVMIGPVAKIDPATLPRRPNIHWLGPKAYEALPAYLAGWEVGLMPFALNEATRFISPTKTPEFLAAGVPVVSTAVRDVLRPYGEAGLVAIAADAPAFVRGADRLMRGARAPWLQQVDRHLAGQDWGATWNAMHALMERARRARPPRAVDPRRAGMAS